jgi:hypothetical protein
VALKNLHQEYFSILYFFFTLPPGLARGRNVDANLDHRMYISVWGGEFCQVYIFAKLVCQTVGSKFFIFYQN